MPFDILTSDVHENDDFVIVNKVESRNSAHLSTIHFASLEASFDELFRDPNMNIKNLSIDVFRMRFNNDKRLFYCFFTKLSTKVSAHQLEKMIWLIPEYGTWKDLLEIYDYSAKFCLNPALMSSLIDIYTNQLAADFTSHQKNLNFSNAAKWAPRECSKYDKLHKLASKFAERLFPHHKHSESLKAYRKMIVILSEKKQVIEPKMCKKQWDSISYVSRENFIKYEKALKRHEKNDLFIKNDETRRTFSVNKFDDIF